MDDLKSFAWLIAGLGSLVLAGVVIASLIWR